jgi:hypothetical protein
LNLIFKCDIVGFSLYLVIKVDLNVPFYFASLEKMIIDFPINRIWNEKDNCLLDIYMLKLIEGHMNAIILK